MGRQRIHLRSATPGLEGKTWNSDYLLRIGRLDDLEVVFNDPSVSRRHAEITFTDQGWLVRDLGSTNGTFVNGLRVGRGGQKLRPRDQLVCGHLTLAVVSVEETEAGPDTSEGSDKVYGAVQGSWEQSLQAVLGPDGPGPAREQLLTLLRVGRDFTHATSLDGLLQTVLQDALVALGAQRGTVLLADGATAARLVTRAVFPSGGLPEEPAWLSRGLAQRAFNRGESLLGYHLPGPPGLPADGEPHHSVVCALLRSPRKRLGVLYLERGPHREPFDNAALRLADALAASVSATLESVGHFLDKERALLIPMLTALAQAVELRDDYTGSHTQRVTDYALLIAEELKLSPAERHYLQIGTPLHDIGKIGISDAILRKQGRLTDEEFLYMQSHTWKGAAILEIIPHLRPILPIIRHHHEHWDGSGYPDRLGGSQISCLGRVVAVADAFDAMTTDRPYRLGMPPAQAFEEIRKKAGTQFDPDCAHAFLRLRPRIEEMLHQLRLLSETSAEPLRVLGPAAPVAPTSPSGIRGRTQAIPRVSAAMIQQRQQERERAARPAEQPPAGPGPVPASGSRCA